MTTKKEMVEMLTREGEPEAAALFTNMTDDEYAACQVRAQKIADVFIKDPLMMEELKDVVHHGDSQDDGLDAFRWQWPTTETN
jgi:hypothetical protein